MRILLTNDDSHNSPLLKSVIEKLETLGELTVVLPAEEQSWKGKSMSRFDPIHLGEEEIFGRKVNTISGTPADCVNFAIYHLYKEKPDLVVSGINTGLNSGVGFMFSSGTVGACFEANIAGVPAVALSQHFDSEAFARYYSEGDLDPAISDKKNAQASKIIDSLFKILLENPSYLEHPITWNVNLPIDLSEETEFKVCSLGDVVYGSCFVKHDSKYSHSITDISGEDEEGFDSYEVLSGHVSISPLDIFSFGKVDDESLEALRGVWNRKIL